MTSPADLKKQINDHLEHSRQLGKQPLISVIGPTGSGKTALGIALANQFSGEIISADSRQIYLEMNIGTAKPTIAERNSAKHHLIDFISPAQPYALSDFLDDAKAAINHISNSGNLPIIVGGTGLYVSALTKNYQLPDSKPDLSYRQELEQIALEFGKEKVHQMLVEQDPLKAASIPPQNLRYVIRALEVIRAGAGESQSSFNQADSPYHTFYITIDWPRQELYQKIEQRIDQMIELGLIDETSNLLKKYPANLPAMSSLGYQEINQYLQGNISLPEAIQEFKKHSRQFAKRQLTWFRKFQHVYSIPGHQLSDFLEQLAVIKSTVLPKYPHE